MKKIDENKLRALTTAEKQLTEKYGAEGTSGRRDFEARAETWYYAELLRDERKRQKMTQQQNASLCRCTATEKSVC